MRQCPQCGRRYEADELFCARDGAELTRVLDPGDLVGQMVDRRYRLGEVIGAGTSSVVYRARHEALGRDVALKFLLHEGVSDNPRLVDRFLREIRAIAAIDHPSIVELHDGGFDPDLGYFAAMRLLRGRDLEARLRDGEPLSSLELYAVLIPTLHALEAAHAARVLHRDLKPANIFLAEAPEAPQGYVVRLLDFGVAKVLAGAGPSLDERNLTRQHHIVGTPHVMAPEQVRGGDVDARADLYSLGSVAFRMVTGAYPFHAKNVRDVLFRRLAEAAPRAKWHPDAAWIPDALDDLLAALLQRDPDERPSSTREVRERLEAMRPLVEAAWIERRLGGPPPVAPEPPRWGPIVLGVDDEPAMREVLAIVGADAGVRLETAADGHAALEWIQEHGNPDAVILDVLMPRVDGLEVLGELRQLGYDGPVFLFTTLDSERLRELAQAARNVELIHKARDLTRLTERLRALHPAA